MNRRGFWPLMVLAAACLGNMGITCGCGGGSGNSVISFEADEEEISYGYAAHIQLSYYYDPSITCQIRMRNLAGDWNTSRSNVEVEVTEREDDYGYLVLEAEVRLTESAEFGAFCRIDGEPEWLDQTVTVRVFNVPPEIIAFIASPGTVAAGTPVNLLWTVRDADSCLIQPGDLDVPPGTGSLEVMPPATTVYSLICLRETVNRHAQAVVTVTP